VAIYAEGFVPKVAGYARVDDQPRWQAYDSGLARPASVTGRVADDKDQPLADVEVRFQNVTTSSGGNYESPADYSCKTDADGRFRVNQLPIGRVTIWLHKPGYCRPGPGEAITTPKADVKLNMMKATRVLVTVDFGGNARPGAYIVNIDPEGGSAVGKYGGSGHIDGKNQIAFENVPPGRYVLRGQPNPSSGNQQTEQVTIETKGGRTVEVTLTAKP
jgi:hypothetical protein